jgi:hypothetical protein
LGFQAVPPAARVQQAQQVQQGQRDQQGQQVLMALTALTVRLDQLALQALRVPLVRRARLVLQARPASGCKSRRPNTTRCRRLIRQRSMW